MNDTRTLELADDLAWLHAKHKGFFDEMPPDAECGEEELMLRFAASWLANAAMCARRAAKGTYTAVCRPDGSPRWL